MQKILLGGFVIPLKYYICIDDTGNIYTMNSKESKIKAINNRESHNNRCDLRKYNEEGNEKRCTNCCEFFSFDKLNNSGRCKSCWTLEAKYRRRGTIKEYQREIKIIWENIEKEYFKKGVKKCNTCLNIQPFNEFYLEKNTWDNHQNKCKKCTTQYNSHYNPYDKEYNKKQHKKYYDNKRKTDPQYKMVLGLRNRLNKKIKEYNLKKSSSSLDLLGISLEDFIYYIEKQWVKGYMNWQNWGEVWELDHKKPISSFNLTDKTQLKECFNYKNFQPLFKLTTIIGGVEYLGNRNKSNKII